MTAIKRRHFVLVALLCTVIINYLDRTNISIAALELRSELKLSPTSLGLVFSAFSWTYSVCQLPGGILADRLRPRSLYPLLLALWSVATFAQGFASSLAMLVVCRALVGAFEAPSYPINNRVVSSWFPENERAGAIGIYTAGQFLGLAVMAPLLVAFQATFGWRALFFGCGIIGIAWAWVWHAVYRDPDQDSRLGETERAEMKVGGALAEWPARASGGLRSFRLQELREAFVHRSLWGLYIGQFCIGTLTAFFLSWFPTYLVEYRGIALGNVGVMASVPFLAAIAGVILSGLVSDALLRAGWSASRARKTPVLVGMALSSVIVGAAFVRGNGAALALISIAFFGNGLASINWVFVSLMAPQSSLGLVGGVFNLIGGLSAVVTPIAIGVLVPGSDFTPALSYISVVAILGFFSYLRLVGKVERISSQSADRASVAAMGS